MAMTWYGCMWLYGYMAWYSSFIIVVIRAPPKPHIFAVYSHKTLA